MPKMFNKNPRIGIETYSNISGSTNNNQLTKSMRFSQLTRSVKYSVNRTIANTFGAINILLSSSTLPINAPVGTEIGRISSISINSFAFTYNVDDIVNFYIQDDKLYTNTVFTEPTLSYTIRITSNYDTSSFSKQFTIAV